MTDINFDIVISGGGVAGLVAACAFGSAGFQTLCVDPSPPVTDDAVEGADLRTTAYLAPSRAFLEDIGIWGLLDQEPMSLKTMRIVDAGGSSAAARSIRDFNADEIKRDAFGYNLRNTTMRRALLARLAQLPNVTFRPGVAVTDLFTRTVQAQVALSDGARVTADLVVAADGRASFVREAAGIGVKRHAFGQSALTFAVTHKVPHDNISTEVHRTGGPFTLVPLPDMDGLPCSAVVWMETDANAKDLLALDEASFSAAATERSCQMVGPLNLVSRRTAWPIISQIADRFAGQRVALVAEAAHVIPPIGAQGLNMSLADIATLLDLAKADRACLGGADMLASYEAGRKRDTATRVYGVSALNHASMATARPLRELRLAGLTALSSIGPVKRGLMRLGLGG